MTKVDWFPYIVQFKIEYGQEMPQPQTNPRTWHREEEIQNNNSHITAT